MLDYCPWVITLLAGVATATIYFLQLRKMDQSIKAQNLVWLMQYLQAKDVRHARFVVTNQLSNKPVSQWSPEEREQAATACAPYGAAGVFIELGRVDKDIIVKYWGPSIWKISEACSDFIAEQREQNGGQYWRGLETLRHLVQKEFPSLTDILLTTGLPNSRW